MLIPREDGKVRLYTEIGPDEGVIDKATGRLDRTALPASRLLEVFIYHLYTVEAVELTMSMQISTKAFAPYIMTTTPENVEWYTVYLSRYSLAQPSIGSMNDLLLQLVNGSHLSFQSTTEFSLLEMRVIRILLKEVCCM